MRGALTPEEEQRLLRCIAAIEHPGAIAETLTTLRHFLEGSPSLVPQLCAPKVPPPRV
jgi:hypothetical protein